MYKPGVHGAARTTWNKERARQHTSEMAQYTKLDMSKHVSNGYTTRVMRELLANAAANGARKPSKIRPYREGPFQNPCQS